jgi:hypothetical protein
MNQIKTATRADLKNFIIAWNTMYPLDKWWRDKYKIPFNSSAHREISMLDICLEYEEDLIFNRPIKTEQHSIVLKKYTPGQGLTLNPQDNDFFDDDNIPSWFNKIGNE